MREAVVVTSSRTALAKSFRGSFNLTRPDDLAAHCIQDVLRKTPKLDPKEVEDVVLGCGQPHGPQGHNVARVAALLAGLPASVAASTINRFCSSGVQAIAVAAHQIMNEGVDAAIGGGVESISMAVRDTSPNPRLQEKAPGVYMAMGDTAEVVAKRYKVTRQMQDEYSLLSQQRTARAQQEGFFQKEIAPLKVTKGILDKKTNEIVGKEDVCADKDECNRADTTLEGLLSLKPHFDPHSGQGSVTAGNSSQLSDGASATLLMSRERADQLGIPYQLIFRGFQVAGCEPDEMGIGPVFAIPKLLKRTGLKMDDVDIWELNEAFAVQVVYCRDRLGINPEKLNVNGGSIAIGHPFGMTGSRMVGTMANEMARRKARYGVVTMCIGGGQGAAALFERAS
ncbi:MAG TPA: thiolase family protein [Candidatus Saccharimonadales bacterium]|jgi:acetyl-CoA acyltransferase|nr:thiolase family protein [Candidatus Saccharimonadales bacterium]